MPVHWRGYQRRWYRWEHVRQIYTRKGSQIPQTKWDDRRSPIQHWQEQWDVDSSHVHLTHSNKPNKNETKINTHDTKIDHEETKSPNQWHVEECCTENRYPECNKLSELQNEVQKLKLWSHHYKINNSNTDTEATYDIRKNKNKNYHATNMKNIPTKQRNGTQQSTSSNPCERDPRESKRSITDATR